MTTLAQVFAEAAGPAHPDMGLVAMEMAAPFGWPGGKRRLSQLILSLIPSHKTYVEPFAGAASIFWAKEPAPVEVLNDTDKDLMRFYRDIGQADQCDTTEVAKDWESLRDRQGELSPCEFFSAIKCSFGQGGPQRGAALDSNSCGTGQPHFHKTLPEYQTRLQRTILHQGDWEPVVRQYDAPDTFFYLDPPYPGPSSRYTGGNSNVLSRLAQVLPALEGKWLLSYADVPEARAAFRGFSIRSVTTTYTLAAASNNMKKRELLIANYPIGRHGMEQPPDMTKVGPVAWAELHAWASNFAAKVGDSCGCGAFAQDAAKALHDVVNLGLGKPALFPENLKAMAQVFQEAAGRVSQASTVKEPWQMTRAEFDKVYETQSKRSFSASLWAKLTLEERRTLIEEGRTYRRHTIEEAVRAGKPVPPEVLAEYPDLRPRLFATQANIYPWPEGMVDDDEEEEEGDMKQGRYPRTKLFDSEAEAREWAEGFRERLLPHLSVPHWEVHKWPQEWEPVEGATTWEVVYWYPHKEGVRLSQSFIDTILHTVVGTATATAVSKALTSDIKEGEKPKDAPAVLSPAHVEGDQANVDLGTLLEEIDAILKKPETMGIVDADTLVVVRE